MKKFYASHCLYHPLLRRLQKQTIIELENGIFFRSYPLVEEVHSVIWLEGIIILSNIDNYIMSTGMSFQQLIESMIAKADIYLPLYAYHIDGVNLQKNLLLPDAVLTKLD